MAALHPGGWTAGWTALTVAGAVVVVGCSTTKPAAIPSAPPPSSSTAAASPAAPTTAPARISKWFELQPGDCLAGPPPTDPAVVEVTIVDCATPHQAETFLRAAIPVNAAVSDTGNAQCEAGFEQYTGVPLAGSGYALAYLIDSEQDRTDNNPYPSTVICLLQGATGQPLTGSARATDR